MGVSHAANSSRRPPADRVAGEGGKLDLSWLEPPASMGDVTILCVLEAGNPTGDGEAARLWADSLLEAWSAYHETVRLWAIR